MSAPIAAAIERSLTTLIGELLTTLDGIPEEVFTTWRPAAAREDGHEMNTFAALAAHTLGSVEYWTLMAAGTRPMTRQRETEFVARATLTELQRNFAAFLTDLRATLVDLDADSLAEDAAPRLNRTGEQWPLTDCLLHAVDHTALHLGQVQIQRQLWEYEQGRQ